MVERVTIPDDAPEGLQPGTPEYEAHMIAVAEGKVKPDGKPQEIAPAVDKDGKPVEVTPMPDGGVAKFYNKDTGEYNWEAHAKDVEFRAKQSEKDKAKAKGEDAEGESKSDLEISEDEDSDGEEAEQSGLDVDKYVQEFAEKGELSQESFDELAKQGLAPEIVEAFIAGQQALAEVTRNTVFDSVGGKENYEAMTTWARENLDKADIEAFNRATRSPDIATIKLAVGGLYAQYTAAEGQRPAREVTGKTNTAAGLGGYKSQAEVVQAMSDPRYRGPLADPAYIQEVQDRLARSNF